jgi:hypothetical protein
MQSLDFIERHAPVRVALVQKQHAVQFVPEGPFGGDELL